MSAIPGYKGSAHPLSSPIEALTVVCTAAYNHQAAGIRSCENAFHLASTILGGRVIVKEFYYCPNLADFSWLGPD
jgi:hypothetical protein